VRAPLLRIEPWRPLSLLEALLACFKSPNFFLVIAMPYAFQGTATFPFFVCERSLFRKPSPFLAERLVGASTTSSGRLAQNDPPFYQGISEFMVLSLFPCGEMRNGATFACSAREAQLRPEQGLEPLSASFWRCEFCLFEGGAS